MEIIANEMKVPGVLVALPFLSMEKIPSFQLITTVVKPSSIQRANASNDNLAKK